MTWETPTYSTARLDSLVCPVMVDSAHLKSHLPVRLSLPRFPHFPDERHPVIVEIWRVQDGLIEFGGRTAHRWWELAGGAAGLGFGGSGGAALGAGLGGAAGAANGAALGMWLGPLGWLWGAAGGAAAGAAYGATMFCAAGAWCGARMAADAGYTASENSSRVIGTYNEIVVTVPCRLMLHDRPPIDVAFVLGTYTDSVASTLGEAIVGWGYRKSLVSGGLTSDGTLEVYIDSSGGPFRIVSRQVSPPLPLSAAGTEAAQMRRALPGPLLGVLPARRFVISSMDRSFEDPAVRVTAVSVRLESLDALLPGLGVVSCDIAALGSREPWGAFSISALPVTLSYPCAVDH
jgi:hypothetical protein